MAAYIKLMFILLTFVYSTKGKSVLIVGGGISGLAAGRELVNKGHTVKIYEANRHYYLGRVRTENLLGGILVDLGAEYIVDSSNSPVWSLLQKVSYYTYFDLDAETVDVSERSYQVFNNSTPIDQDHVDRIINRFREFSSGLASDAYRVNDTLQLAMADGGYDALLNDPVGRVLRQNLLDVLYGAGPGDISARLFKHQQKFPRGNVKVLKRGMTFVSEKLLHGLGGEEDGLVLYPGELVTKITSTGRQAKVEIMQNQDKKTEYYDDVIVTVPLGILKENFIEFDPPLNPRKLRAIKNVGFGRVEKLFISFKKKFWDDRFTSLSVVPPDGDLTATTFYDMSHVFNEPVLTTFSVGSTASDLENTAKKNLKAMFGSAYDDSMIKVTMPTTWADQSSFRGSLPYIASGSLPCDWEYLARPHCELPPSPGVYFAGDATSYHLGGTIDAAYTSGLRAARQVLDDVCRTQGLPDIDCTIVSHSTTLTPPSLLTTVTCFVVVLRASCR